MNENQIPIFRLLEKRDFEGVLELMKEIRPDIAGSRDPDLYHALCYEALADKRVVFIVGEMQSKIIAFYLAVIDPNRWRFAFMLRHPLLGMGRAFNVLLDRSKRLLKKNIKKGNDHVTELQNISQYLTFVPTTKSWRDSSLEIAKILFDAVAESHRGLHIAKGMRELMYKILAERGARRVDATILFTNIRSVRVAHGVGFKIYIMGDQLFATKDL